MVHHVNSSCFVDRRRACDTVYFSRSQFALTGLVQGAQIAIVRFLSLVAQLEGKIQVCTAPPSTPKGQQGMTFLCVS